MSGNVSSSDLVVTQGLAESKMASATDRHVGGLRHESDLHAISQANHTWEQNLREAANLEVGRARNLSQIV